MLEVGLTVRQYLHVDDSPVSTHSARHHLHQLKVLYPQPLSPTAIWGCFARLPCDDTLIRGPSFKAIYSMCNCKLTKWLRLLVTEINLSDCLI